MPVRVEISSANEASRNRRGKYFRRREKWRRGEGAFNFSLLSFGSVGIDCINISTQQRHDSLPVVRVTTDEIGHAIFIEISSRQAERFSQILFQRLPQFVRADVGCKQIVAIT